MVVENKIIFWVVIIFFTMITVLFYLTTEKKVEEKKLVPLGESVPVPSSELPRQAPTENNVVKVQEDNGNHTVIRYEDNSFKPSSITIQNETGCFVEIQNKTAQDVIPRLGPYDPKKEKGFLYPVIAPHGISLIDPRYGTLIQSSFYNKNNSSATFVVHVDPTCL